MAVKAPFSSGPFFFVAPEALMVMRKLVSSMAGEAARPARKGRIARWIGRNSAHFTYATRVEPTWLELNELCIPIADLPEAFAGLRIVQMSDFHSGHQVTDAYLAEAV